MFELLALPFALAFPALVIVAAIRDVTSYTIPNWISLALVTAFVPAAIVSGQPLPALGLHLGIGAVALVAGMMMFALRWIGGGDAKLFAAAALWLSWPAAAPFLLTTAIAGGGLAVGLKALRSMWLRPYTLNGPQWFVRLATPDEPAPYGVAIAVGALAAFPQSPIARALGL